MTVADKLITELICRFGCLLQIHSDQGKEFESLQLMSNLWFLFYVQKYSAEYLMLYTSS
jgi:hypothetical protein